MDQQTILVVDDDQDIREGIRILLASESYGIIEAENGQQALNLLSDSVDLMILDIMMPDLSGLRVCEEVRKQSSVPILFLTAKAQDSDKLVGLAAGGDDYLVKPFSYREYYLVSASLYSLTEIFEDSEFTVVARKNQE